MVSSILENRFYFCFQTFHDSMGSFLSSRGVTENAPSSKVTKVIKPKISKFSTKIFSYFLMQDSKMDILDLWCKNLLITDLSSLNFQLLQIFSGWPIKIKSHYFSLLGYNLNFLAGFLLAFIKTHPRCSIIRFYPIFAQSCDEQMLKISRRYLD